MARACFRTACLVGLGVLAAALAFVWVRREPAAVPPSPRVDAVSPLGVWRGYANELTVRGAAMLGNPRLVAPFRFVVASPAPSGSDANTFETRLTVDPDTPLGIYPVRMLTDEGLSDPFPLAVGQLPQIQEKEDNNDVRWRRAVVSRPRREPSDCPRGRCRFTFAFQGISPIRGVVHRRQKFPTERARKHYSWPTSNRTP
jgi:hypothetical protein